MLLQINGVLFQYNNIIVCIIMCVHVIGDTRTGGFNQQESVAI